MTETPNLGVTNAFFAAEPNNKVARHTPGAAPDAAPKPAADAAAPLYRCFVGARVDATSTRPRCFPGPFPTSPGRYPDASPAPPSRRRVLDGSSSTLSNALLALALAHRSPPIRFHAYPRRARPRPPPLSSAARPARSAASPRAQELIEWVRKLPNQTKFLDGKIPHMPWPSQHFEIMLSAGSTRYSLHMTSHEKSEESTIARSEPRANQTIPSRGRRLTRGLGERGGRGSKIESSGVRVRVGSGRRVRTRQDCLD